MNLVPAESDAVLHVDVGALMRSQFGAGFRRLLATTSSVQTHCPDNALDLVQDFTWIRRADRSTGVLVRGAIAEAENEGCLRALSGVFYTSADAETNSVRVVRVDGVALVSNRDVPASQTAMPGPIASASRPDFITALPEFLRTATLTFAATNVEGLASPSSDTAPAAQDGSRVRSFIRDIRTVRAGITVVDNEQLLLRGETMFVEPSRAEQFREWVQSQVLQGTEMLRVGIAQTPSAPGLERARQIVQPLLEGAMDRIAVRAEGSTASIALDASIAEVGTLAAFAIPLFIRETRRARTAEARANTLRIAMLMSTTLRTVRGRRRFLPGTPLTPAVVLSGTRGVDDPSVWAHPTWQALHFSITDPHYYSYQIISDASSFTVRAVGDLDGDGQHATFERVGTMSPNGQVTLQPDLRIQNELE